MAANARVAATLTSSPPTAAEWMRRAGAVTRARAELQRRVVRAGLQTSAEWTAVLGAFAGACGKRSLPSFRRAALALRAVAPSLSAHVTSLEQALDALGDATDARMAERQPPR